MEFSIQQIAALLGGEVKGDGSVKIHTIAKIQEGHAGAISFLSNPKYENYIYTTAASAVIVNKTFEPRQPITATLIVVEDAYTAFSILLEEYAKIVKAAKVGIEQPSFVATSATLGSQVYVGAFAYIGNNAKIGNNVKIYPQCYVGDNVRIGDNTTLYAGVKIYANSEIGRNCTLQAGAVIGSDGFGFAPQADGTYKTIPQLGNVVIKDNVDIGANTTIDCATMGSTIIEDGVKIDNLIQVAHNVSIGKNTVMAAQSGISGSSTLGENCIVAGQVGIIGHLNIANRTTILAQSGVTKNITKEGITILGSPAYEQADSIRMYVAYRKLPDMMKRLDTLEKKVKTMDVQES